MKNKKSKCFNRNFPGEWSKTPGRLLGIALVRFYQITFSSIVGNSCRHFPTCSEYAYEAIARHGLVAGCWLTLFRVAKCNPLGSDGYDPVPEKMQWKRRKRQNNSSANFTYKQSAAISLKKQ